MTRVRPTVSSCSAMRLPPASRPGTARRAQPPRFAAAHDSLKNGAAWRIEIVQPFCGFSRKRCPENLTDVSAVSLVVTRDRSSPHGLHKLFVLLLYAMPVRPPVLYIDDGCRSNQERFRRTWRKITNKSA